jgi:multiple sugar transport system permease protein
MASIAITKEKRLSAALSIRARRRQRAGFLFVLPCVAFVCLFFLLPLLLTFWMSFNDWSIFGITHFIGLNNYISLLHDPIFLNSFVFTTKYTVLVCPLLCIVGFVLALLVQRPLAAVGLFRTVYFLPVVIGFGTASFLWSWLYNDQVGPIDQLLERLDLIHSPILWFNSANAGLWAVIIMIVWKFSGETMLLFLMGIQAIPTELYEAARVDGANAWRCLIDITIPLIRRTFALIMVLIVTGSYLAFDQFYIMTHGGPENQTVTLVQRIYQVGFVYFKLGYAASQSIILLIVLVLINIAQLFLLRGSPED